MLSTVKRIKMFVVVQIFLWFEKIQTSLIFVGFALSWSYYHNLGQMKTKKKDNKPVLYTACYLKKR